MLSKTTGLIRLNNKTYDANNPKTHFYFTADYDVWDVRGTKGELLTDAEMLEAFSVITKFRQKMVYYLKGAPDLLLAQTSALLAWCR